MVAQLQAAQREQARADCDKQQEQTITNRRAQVEASESQLREPAGQGGENTERNCQLQSDLGALARQRQANQKTIDELRTEQERILQDAQSEKQSLWSQNQQLQRELAALRGQVETSETLLGTKSGQYADLMDRHGQLQSDVAAMKQHLDDLTLENNALTEKNDTLLSKLGDTQKTLEELQMLQDATQSDKQHLQTSNQELQRDLARLNLDLQSIQSRLGEAERQAQDSADRQSMLEREAGELKEQLRADQVSIGQFHSEEARWSAVELENQKLRQECADLRERLQSSDSRLSELIRLNQENADHYARFKSEAADLARRLEEAQLQIREFDRLEPELASAESREMILKRRQDEQETQIVSLNRELSEAQGKVQELAMTRNRLAEVERLYEEVRNQHQRLELEISRQQSRDSSKQSLELPVLDPLRPNALPASTNSSTAGPGDLVDDRMPVYPGDDDFHTATEVEQIKARKKPRAAAIAAIVALAVAAGILGTRYLASIDPPVTREFMPAERSAHGEDVSEAAEPTPAPRLQGKFKIVRATAVYSGPTEKSALITRIEPGIKINVVDSRDGWLEIRSKYGRPPGFVREETAVKIDQN